MDLATGTLEDSIELDFCMACVDLAEARRAALIADTPASRARLSGCVHTVDALLDMSNAVASAGPREAADPVPATRPGGSRAPAMG